MIGVATHTIPAYKCWDRRRSQNWNQRLCRVFLCKVFSAKSQVFKQWQHLPLCICISLSFCVGISAAASPGYKNREGHNQPKRHKDYDAWHVMWRENQHQNQHPQHPWQHKNTVTVLISEKSIKIMDQKSQLKSWRLVLMLTLYKNSPTQAIREDTGLSSFWDLEATIF